MAPEITIDEVEIDCVHVEGQKLERRWCSRFHWLAFWNDVKRKGNRTWESGYEAGWKDAQAGRRKYSTDAPFSN